MESLPFDRVDIVFSVAEVVPNKLYWAAVDIGKFAEVLKKEYRTHYIKPVLKASIRLGAAVRSNEPFRATGKENSDLNGSPTKARRAASGARVPCLRGTSLKVLYTDKVFYYKPLANDFGPVDLSTFHRFVDFADQAAESGTVLVHVSDYRRPALCVNSAFLVAAYAMIRFNASARELGSAFSTVNQELLPPFRDASRAMKTSFPLSVQDFCEAIQTAREHSWVDWENFDVAKTERLQQVENGDLNWIVEKKFIAFAGPSSTRLDEDGLDTLPPSHYVGLFREMGVTDVVRLNVSNYDACEFTSQGIKHHELFFEDGSCPPIKTVHAFLTAVQAAEGAVGVHCKAGLGRSATMIGLAVMKQFGVSAKKFIAWARLARPGSVIGPQQQFLLEMEPVMHGNKTLRSFVGTAGGEKGQGERLLKQKRKNAHTLDIYNSK